MASKTTPEIEKNENGFEDEIDVFLDHINSLYFTSPLVTLITKGTILTAKKKANEYLKANLDVKTLNDKKKAISEYKHIARFLELQKNAKNSELAHKIIERNFIVSIVSQFDTFLSSLIRKMFIIKPELLNGSEKNLPYSKLVEFHSIKDAKEYIIEKEIETVLRDNHSNQFKWLESKLGIPLTTDLPSWKDFIEITERRNLFVHSNGKVSNQYIHNCQKNKVTFETPLSIGDTLEVSPDYFKKAYYCFYEIAVKLSQVIWRKLAPDNLSEADTKLNVIIYTLLRRKEYDLCTNLCEFATTTLKKHYNQDTKLIFLINKALAYKLKGDNDICLKIVNSIDWTASSNKLKLAVDILKDNYEGAYTTMIKIGNKDPEVNMHAYQEWPLFQKINTEVKFMKNYEKLFKEPYEAIGFDDGDLIKLLSESTPKTNNQSAIRGHTEKRQIKLIKKEQA